MRMPRDGTIPPRILSTQVVRRDAFQGSPLQPHRAWLPIASFLPRIIKLHTLYRCLLSPPRFLPRYRSLILQGNSFFRGRMPDDECQPQKRGITADDVKTAPMDYRFPATNQTKHCYYSYNEFQKCAAEKGEDAKDCQKYARYYRSLCPGEWVEKWNEERANGTFPGRY